MSDWQEAKSGKFARNMVADNAAGNDLALNPEKLAFYDALTKSEAVKGFYRNE